MCVCNRDESLIQEVENVCVLSLFSVSWTCNFRTKRLGLALKIVVLVSLIVPLGLWPVVAVAGSILGGIGYGVFAPLIATFQAAGQNAIDKCYHCFAVSCLSLGCPVCYLHAKHLF